MKTRIILALLLVAVATLSFARPSGDGEFTWRTDLAAAQLEAGEAGLPLLVVFR